MINLEKLILSLYANTNLSNRREIDKALEKQSLTISGNEIVEIVKSKFKVGDLLCLEEDKSSKVVVLEVNNQTYKLLWLPSTNTSLYDIKFTDKRFILADSDKNTQTIELFGKKMRAVKDKLLISNCHLCALRNECKIVFPNRPCTDANGCSDRHFELISC